jgi:hypothetical protein
MTGSNQNPTANRRSDAQSNGSGNLLAIVATNRAFAASVAELHR